MIFLFYGMLVLGAVLLSLDVSGRFKMSPRWVWALRVVGLASLAFPALVPLAAVYGRWWEWSGDVFPLIAYAYTILAGTYAIAVPVDRGAGSRWLSRVTYACLLALTAFPSSMLLPLAGPTSGWQGSRLRAS